MLSRWRSQSAVGCFTMLMMSTVSHTCLAQSATPGTTIELETILVEAPGGVDQASTRTPVEERFEALPGAVELVESSDYEDAANLTVSEALESVPGVVVQNFFGGNDQPRIQIRGSGLQQNPVERGILMLQNGLPLNRADGSYIVGFANPRQAEAIEVYRGYTANRLGATVLGGALNFVSPTGSSAPGMELLFSGGSFGQLDAAAQHGFAGENFDALFQVDVTRRDGFRDYNSSERVSVDGNVGFAISDNVTTRIFTGFTDLGFDVAGPLTKKAMEADPEQVFTGPTVTPSGVVDPGPNVVRDQPRRDASQFLVGSRTTATFDAHLIDVALGYTYTDDTFRFPISSGVRSTEGGDLTGLVRYAYKPDPARPLPLFEATGQYTVGSATREYWTNVSGEAGAKFGENELDASTLSLFAGFNVPLWEKLTISPAVSYAYATRDSDDTYGQATRPTIAYNPGNPTARLPDGAIAAGDTSYKRSYSGWSPSLAVSYRPFVDQTFFAAVSHSFEPPTHDDLLATVNGTPNSSAGRPNPANPAIAAAAFVTPDLESQTAVTVEGGWRGYANRVSWDVVVYHSWVDNELLSLRDVTGASLGAVNADKTTHFGVELGLGAELTDRLSGRVAYTFQDFRFDDDPVRGENRLAGAPRHLINAALSFAVTENWGVGGSVRWSPEKTPVDNMNTLYADPYVVVDLRTDYRLDERFSLFAEIENVFDETYASSTLIVDQARSDQAAFLPGDGRAFYAGLKATF